MIRKTLAPKKFNFKLSREFHGFSRNLATATATANGTPVIESASSPTTSETAEVPATTNITYGEFSPAQKAYLERLIRVDQAGELGADYIYMGQHFILAPKSPELRDLLQHMWDQEIHHHNTFNRLQTERRVRPSLLTPFWKVGAVALGAGTALISKEAAMACTVAVETVIGGHYNEQLRVLMNQYGTPIYKDGKQVFTSDVPEELRVSPELQSLKKTVGEFRDDELEHLDTAIENDAEKAVPYMLLTEGIKLIVRGAIWSAERV